MSLTSWASAANEARPAAINFEILPQERDQRENIVSGNADNDTALLFRPIDTGRKRQRCGNRGTSRFGSSHDRIKSRARGLHSKQVKHLRSYGKASLGLK